MLPFASAKNFAHGTSLARRNHCASIPSSRDHDTRTMSHHQLPGCPVKGLTTWQNIPKQPAIAPHASSLSRSQSFRLTCCNLIHFQVIVDNGSNSHVIFPNVHMAIFLPDPSLPPWSTVNVCVGGWLCPYKITDGFYLCRHRHCNMTLLDISLLLLNWPVSALPTQP